MAANPTFETTLAVRDACLCLHVVHLALSRAAEGRGVARHSGGQHAKRDAGLERLLAWPEVYSLRSMQEYLPGIPAKRGLSYGATHRCDFRSCLADGPRARKSKAVNYETIEWKR